MKACTKSSMLVSILLASTLSACGLESAPAPPEPPVPAVEPGPSATVVAAPVAPEVPPVAVVAAAYATAPETDDSGAAAEPAADDASDTSCRGADANDDWSDTLTLVERLSGLLPPFAAALPPASCMTEVWAAADPAAAALESALAADFRRTEQARRQSWLSALPREAVWFRAFVPGVSRAEVRGSTVTFTTEPVLTQRVLTDGLEALNQSQHCAVLAAEIEGSDTVLWCGEPGEARDSAAFTVTITEPAVRERLGALALGDVVRFGGYLSLVGEIPRGEADVVRWHFYEVPASEVEVVARGDCCGR
jgi:hypothetical protein